MTNIKNQAAHGLGLLRRYISEKLGIEDYTKLSGDEKKTYDQWEAVLSKELKLDDLRTFLTKQNVVLAKELRDAVEKDEGRKALRIAARIENYEAIVAFIDEPNRSRENLIAQLTNLINSQ